MRLHVFVALALCVSPLLIEARWFQQGKSLKSHKPIGKGTPAPVLGKGMPFSNNRPTYSPNTQPTPQLTIHPTVYPAEGNGKGVQAPTPGKGRKETKGTIGKKGTKGMMTKSDRIDYHKASKPPSPRPTKRPASPSPSVAPPAEPSHEPSAVPTSTPEIGLQPSCFIDDTRKYNICLDLNPGTRTGFQPWMNGLIAAAQRWESVVVGDVPSFPTNDILLSPPAGCTYPEPFIDDIYVCSTIGEIDGEGNIIGSTRILQVRELNGKNISITAFIKFDSADIDALVDENVFDQIAFHEIAHTLGFGLLWDSNNLVNENGEYIGTNAIEQWMDIGCTGSPPLEANFGADTKSIHWSEACLQNEIMTGFFVSKTPLPLSNITIGAMADFGYIVSYAEADEYDQDNLGEECLVELCGQPSRRPCDNITEVPDPTCEKTILGSQELNHIMAYAKKELTEWHDMAMGSNSSESIKIGGSIRVLYLDACGRIHEMVVTWDDIKDLDM